MKPKDFGEYIKELRRLKGLSITALSEVSGISQPYLSQIESGKRGVPKEKLLRKLADALGVPYMKLMYNTGLIDRVPAAVDFLEEDVEKIILWYHNFEKPILKRLEEKYKTYFGENFKITPETLKEILWEEPINPGLGLLLQELTDEHLKMAKIVSENQKEINKSLSSFKPIPDLYQILNDNGSLNFKGKRLSDKEKQQIINMLDVLFPSN